MALGLSPATRGTPDCAGQRRDAVRFIPGYAGNAWMASNTVDCSPVYPRLRGERGSSANACTAAYGLSPATRGTLWVQKSPAKTGRFIPGYAGNAGSGFWPGDLGAVYPRLRGERIRASTTISAVPGLSPATRGTHRKDRKERDDFRFIPGYAGNAVAIAVCENIYAVYPRLRGERSSSPVDKSRLPGLSPATRGTRFRRVGGWLDCRFIPGYAGNAWK